MNMVRSLLHYKFHLNEIRPEGCSGKMDDTNCCTAG